MIPRIGDNPPMRKLASALALMFSATAWANYADNAATTPQTNIHVALATADPGDAGTMSTSEATYTSYARVNVARTSGGWEDGPL